MKKIYGYRIKKWLEHPHIRISVSFRLAHDTQIKLYPIDMIHIMPKLVALTREVGLLHPHTRLHGDRAIKEFIELKSTLLWRKETALQVRFYCSLRHANTVMSFIYTFWRTFWLFPFSFTDRDSYALLLHWRISQKQDYYAG